MIKDWPNRVMSHEWPNTDMRVITITHTGRYGEFNSIYVMPKNCLVIGNKTRIKL